MARTDSPLLEPEFLKKLEHLQIRVRRILSGQQQAERRSRKIGSSLEFADYRTYAPGDDPRRIDWSIYGRLGRLVTRLYEEEEDLAVAILIDSSASMRLDPSKWRLTLQLAAGLSSLGLRHLDRVGLWFFDETIRAESGLFRGQPSFHKLLTFLDTPPRRPGGTDLRKSLGRFARHSRRKALAIVLSDGLDPRGSEEGLALLTSSRFEVHFIHLLAESELTPRLEGDWLLQDSESSDTLRITATPALLRAYHDEVKRFQTGLRSWCHRHRAGYSLVSAKEPFDDALLRLLRRDGLLQ